MRKPTNCFFKNTAIRFRREGPLACTIFFLATALLSFFNSWVMNLYDEDKLIGVGVFDIGKKSAAGVVSFYDPDYKSHSIGRYLIYKKIEYCKQRRLDFFYPGYFVKGIKAFDYKLEIGKDCLEYFDMSRRLWKPISRLVIRKDE